MWLSLIRLAVKDIQTKRRGAPVCPSVGYTGPPQSLSMALIGLLAHGAVRRQHRLDAEGILKFEFRLEIQRLDAPLVEILGQFQIDVGRNFHPGLGEGLTQQAASDFMAMATASPQMRPASVGL